MKNNNVGDSIKNYILTTKKGFKLTKEDGQYVAIDNGKRFYNWNNDPKREFIYLSIKEDGETRIVFNGSVISLLEFEIIDSCTFP